MKLRLCYSFLLLDGIRLLDGELLGSKIDVVFIMLGCKMTDSSTASIFASPTPFTSATGTGGASPTVSASAFLSSNPSVIPSAIRYSVPPTSSASPVYAPTVIIQESVVTIKTEYVYVFGLGIGILILLLVLKICDLKEKKKSAVASSKVTVNNPMNSV